ncbi:sce7726 family protein [Salmonella enterica subsp. enterica serovar Florida]|nr:sce7726 family protein [Salmonella enterica subsp. enterica serovar Florida]
MEVNMLNDNKIRTALINFLLAKKPAPEKIIEELHIENGRAIADVVAAYSYLHCYEIKGETDSIGRILTQANYYNTSFNKITLVTTKNHLTWALKRSPTFWGIILVELKDNNITFKYIRGAKDNIFFRKENAFMMLWKDEMLKVANEASVPVKRSHTRLEIAEMLSSSLKKSDALQTIQSIISNRLKLRDAV